MSKIVPVILCGGSGSRLWPLSRSDTPKQFLRLMDDQTLLQRTVLRTMKITDADETDMVIVTLNSMKPETIRQLREISPGLTRHILGEPQARNTAAAVAYAITYVQKTFGDDAIIWILPSDHFVGDEIALSEALHKAVEAAGDDYMVTFGIQPTRPETGYGYILKAETLIGTDAYKVDRFVEKPPYDLAVEFVASGEYFWSSGMHVFKAGIAAENYQRHAPVTWNTVRRALQESFTENKPSSFVYGTAKEEPFETAVMERAEKVAVIPCDPQWSDIGCWDSLWEIKGKNESGNATHGRVVCEETENSMILAHDRLVTCVGLNGVIVIETADSVLVANRQCNESLKALVKNLQKNGHKETVSSPMAAHSWGFRKTLAQNARHMICEMVVKPGQMQDLEAHADLSGYWIVTAGEALFMVDGTYRRLAETESIFIPSQSAYRLANPGEKDLRIFHFQCQEDEKELRIRPGQTVNADGDVSSKHMAA